MRFLISTLSFTKCIETAIRENPYSFEVQQEAVVFSPTNKAKIHRVGVYNLKTIYNGKFDSEYWAGVLFFLKQLQEQPIVVEITEFMHPKFEDKVEMNFSQFEKYF